MDYIKYLTFTIDEGYCISDILAHDTEKDAIKHITFTTSLSELDYYRLIKIDLKDSRKFKLSIEG